jgi:hypothetical protein
MTHRTRTGIALLLFIQTLVGCGGSGAPSTPGAPTPLAAAVPPSASTQLVAFKDPLTGLSTSDVHDAQDHVVQFTTANELVWIDGTHHQLQNSAGVPSCQCWLVVRFGATNGERRAYMTADVGHSNPGTLVDLEITDSGLVVSWTDLFPPGTYTLSGVVTEAATTGPVPIENAEVWRLDEEQSGWDHATTNKNGFYQLHGLSDGSRRASFSKDGYQKIEQNDVPVHGDTQFDVQLVRR